MEVVRRGPVTHPRKNEATCSAHISLGNGLNQNMTTIAKKPGKCKWILDYLKVATWNVRGIANKESELTKILEDKHINVAVLTETKKKLKGSKYIGNYAMFYSGVNQDCRAAKGVSILVDKKWESRIKECQYINERIITIKLKHDRGYLVVIGAYAPEEGKKEETDEFYKTLQIILDKYNSRYEVLLMGDMNARVGNIGIPNVMGTCGEGVKNSNGEKLIEFAAFNELSISNTFKKKKDIHKFTWAARGCRSVIDYVIGNKKIAKHIEDTTVKRGSDIGSDHFLVISRIKLLTRWKKERITQARNKNEEVYKVYLLETESIRNLYQNRINTYLQDHTTSDNIEEEWQNIKKIITKAASESLGHRKKYRKRKGLKIWTEEIESCIKDKQKKYETYLNSPTEDNREEYKKARNVAKTIIKKAHTESWERFIGCIEHDLHGRQSLAYKVIKTLNKNERENIQINAIDKQSWIEHYKKLWYNEEESGATDNYACKEVDSLTIEELLEALKRSKNRKATGLNGINTELLKYAGILFHLRLLHLYNMCWKLGQIPKEWYQAKVISLYKKGDRTNPNNYRGISLLDTTYKIYARMLNERLKKIADHLISEEQVGFRKGRSCMDAVFTLKRIIEERREFNCETHLAFIDLEKAFDNIDRELLWNILIRRGYPKHLVEAIKSLYKETSICLVIGGNLTEAIPTNKGVRQGCSISPTLFNIYIDDMFRTWKSYVNPGIYLKNNTFLNSLLYADDKVIIQDSEDKLQKSIYVLNKITKEYNFKIAAQKTKTMAFKGKYPIRTKIVIDEIIIEQVKYFKYLGCYISYERDIDLDKKLNNFRNVCGTIHRSLKNKTRKDTRIKFFNTIAVPMLTYGSEARIMTEKDKSKVQVAEMKFMRSTLGCTIQDKKKNIDIRKKLEVEPLLEKLKRNNRRWCEHLQRMPNYRLPALAMGYKPKGRRDVGRPRAKWAPEQVQHEPNP